MTRVVLATAEPAPGGVETCPPEEGAVERCLAAGRHVVLVAPSPLSAAALRRLAAVGGPAGAQLGLLNPDRYLPSRRLIRQQLDAGKLGEPGLVRIHRWCGGACRDQYLRDLDVAMWLVGRAPNLVYALEIGCGPQIHLGFPDGPMALVDVAELPPGDDYRSLHLIGSAGAAYADDQQNAQLRFKGGSARALPVPEDGSALLALVRDAAVTVTAGRRLPSIDDWRRVEAVAEAARRSIETHDAVPLELD